MLALARNYAIKFAICGDAWIVDAMLRRCSDVLAERFSQYRRTNELEGRVRVAVMKEFGDLVR
jgi:hypothetical protein